MSKPDALDLQIEVEPRRVAHRNATPTGPVLTEASRALRDLGAVLESATVGFTEEIGRAGPATVSLELNVRLSMEGKWLIVAYGEGEATAKVSMTWKRTME